MRAGPIQYGRGFQWRRWSLRRFHAQRKPLVVLRFGSTWFQFGFREVNIPRKGEA